MATELSEAWPMEIEEPSAKEDAQVSARLSSVKRVEEDSVIDLLHTLRKEEIHRFNITVTIMSMVIMSLIYYIESLRSDIRRLASVRQFL